MCGIEKGRQVSRLTKKPFKARQTIKKNKLKKGKTAEKASFEANTRVDIRKANKWLCILAII